MKGFYIKKLHFLLKSAIFIVSIILINVLLKKRLQDYAYA